MQGLEGTQVLDGRPPGQEAQVPCVAPLLPAFGLDQTTSGVRFSSSSSKGGGRGRPLTMLVLVLPHRVGRLL